MVSGTSDNQAGVVVVGGASSGDASTTTKIVSTILMIVAGIVGSSWGPYVAGALILLTGIGAVIFHNVIINWQFNSDKDTAGSKAGASASTDQKKVDDNFDQVDDFLHRPRRTDDREE